MVRAKLFMMNFEIFTMAVNLTSRAISSGVPADEVACKHVDLTTRDDLPRGFEPPRLLGDLV